MDTSVLREIGLNDTEIRVYLELLRSEPEPASAIADRAGVNRTLAYQVLGNLIKRGLVGYVIKSNVRYYRAAHPAKLLEYLKEKEGTIEQLVPELLKMARPSEKKYSAEIFEGKEGLKTILNDVLSSKSKEFLDFTSGMSTKVLSELTIGAWHKKREKAKIFGKFLFNRTGLGLMRAKEIKQGKYTQIRLCPKGLEFPGHIYIYGNKVALTLWVEDFPFGILIESKELHERFKKFFEWFWEKSSEKY